jgi:hypothetical protein
MNWSKFLYKIIYLKKQTGLYIQVLKSVIEFILSFISFCYIFKILRLRKNFLFCIINILLWSEMENLSCKVVYKSYRKNGEKGKILTQENCSFILVRN